jgi:tripartite-type tricarboxylate transporter receptor subunit TctC
MRRFAVAALGALLGFTGLAQAQETKWPERQVNVIVPFTAGGTTDMFARILAQHMQAKLGPPFIVENRAGAAGNVGSTAVARAAKDGYTILVGTVSTHAINPFLYKNLAHDTEKDFQPVSLIARLPNLLVVHPRIPAKNVAELIEHLKANPGKLSYGSSGAGTSTHLASELFQMTTGTKMTHVPFRSSGDVMNSINGGHIDLTFDNMTLAWPQAQAGTVRALAVSSLERSPTAPDVPAVSETLKGFEATSWHGVFVPAGTPRPVVDKLNGEIRRILELPEVQSKLKEIGAVPSPMSPKDFTAFIKAERDKWSGVVKTAGVSAN